MNKEASINYGQLRTLLYHRLLLSPFVPILLLCLAEQDAESEQDINRRKIHQAKEHICYQKMPCYPTQIEIKYIF